MVHRVQANTDPENKVSQRIFEKVGFKKEGVSRKSSFVRGEWRDEYHYAILREEWATARALYGRNGYFKKSLFHTMSTSLEETSVYCSTNLWCIILVNRHCVS